jgi:hypothetical protein
MEPGVKLPERHAARVLLVNADDRILLFHAWSDPSRRDHLRRGWECGRRPPRCGG